jgi:hypothetical protein
VVKHVVVGGVGPVYPKIPGQFIRDDTKLEGLNVEVASAAVDSRNMTERMPQRGRKLLKACIMWIVFEGSDIVLERWLFVVKYSLLSCVVVKSHKDLRRGRATSLAYMPTIFQRYVIHLLEKRPDSKDQISEGQG